MALTLGSGCNGAPGRSQSRLTTMNPWALKNSMAKAWCLVGNDASSAKVRPPARSSHTCARAGSWLAASTARMVSSMVVLEKLVATRVCSAGFALQRP